MKFLSTIKSFLAKLDDLFTERYQDKIEHLLKFAKTPADVERILRQHEISNRRYF